MGRFPHTKLKKGLCRDTRVVIQGFGNVGYHTANFFSADAKIICVAEYDGYVLNENGLDIAKLKAHYDSTGSVCGFAGAKTVLSKDMTAETDPLALECEVLIPAAKEMVISKENTWDIKAKVIGEAANGPCTFEADEYLSAQGVLIVPDFYLNAGGVCVSYFEWLKNLNHVRWGRMTHRLDGQRGQAVASALASGGIELDEKSRKLLVQGASEKDFVCSALAGAMMDALDQVIDEALERNVDLRTAAMATSVQKVYNVMKLSGNIFTQ